jgi:hypothetical protein
MEKADNDILCSGTILGPLNYDSGLLYLHTPSASPFHSSIDAYYNITAKLAGEP